MAQPLDKAAVIDFIKQHPKDFPLDVQIKQLLKPLKGAKAAALSEAGTAALPEEGAKTPLEEGAATPPKAGAAAPLKEAAATPPEAGAAAPLKEAAATSPEAAAATRPEAAAATRPGQRSKKYQVFVNELMGMKNVGVVPGIGRAAKGMLETRFPHACQLFDKYLEVARNRDTMTTWLTENAEMSTKDITECCDALEAYVNLLLGRLK